MKTNHIKLERWAAWAAIAVTVCGLMGATAYVGGEQETHPEMSNATMLRLCQDLRVASVLRKLHAGEVKPAMRELDLLLCDDVIGINSLLGSAKREDRALIKGAFRSIGLIRPPSAALMAGTGQDLLADQIQAATILERAANGMASGNKKVAALP
jgi:hypothetical protein